MFKQPAHLQGKPKGGSVKSGKLQQLVGTPPPCDWLRRLKAVLLKSFLSLPELGSPFWTDGGTKSSSNPDKGAGNAAT